MRIIGYYNNERILAYFKIEFLIPTTNAVFIASNNFK